MSTTTTSALSLQAGAGFYNNTGIAVNVQLQTNTATYQALPLIATLTEALTLASANSSPISANVLPAMQSIGATPGPGYCPALGDAAPANVSANIGNSVSFSQAVLDNASSYLGSGSFTKFAQAFAGAQGYVTLTNQIINSVFNSNQYLGPTFEDMDDLISGDLTRINLATQIFGQDLAKLGELFRPSNLGTPAALLQQLSNVGNMLNGTLPSVRITLIDEGLTDQDIADLVNNNVQSLFNPDGLSPQAFDSLQKRAYPGLCNVTGADLQDVLDILGVTVGNITSMCQLLDPVKIFPNSFPSLTLPTPDGDVLIYDENGSVNSIIEPILNSGEVTPVGCDALGKILPSAVAVANRALQISFGQVKGIDNLTLPQLAAILA